MKSTRNTHPARSARESKQNTKQSHEPTLRACEFAAARLKAAGDDLASSWTALCHEIVSGVSPTDLLRKRAWCNVLELRLKEQAQALEQARHGVDAIWEELMLDRCARSLYNPLLRRNAPDATTNPENFPLLARTASGVAAAHRRTAPLKK